MTLAGTRTQQLAWPHALATPHRLLALAPERTGQGLAGRWHRRGALATPHAHECCVPTVELGARGRGKVWYAARARERERTSRKGSCLELATSEGRAARGHRAARGPT
jgi:hypothetical protein